MNTISPFSFQLRSNVNFRNVSYQDSSLYNLEAWLGMNIRGIANEISPEVARAKYERIPTERQLIKELIAEMGSDSLILGESNLPLSLFTYLYTYLQSAVSARLAENPESTLLEIWQRAEFALLRMSKVEIEEDVQTVKECASALFAGEKIEILFHHLIEIAGKESNYMDCTIGFLMGFFKEDLKNRTTSFPYQHLDGEEDFIEITNMEIVPIDAHILMQALYDTYKKIPERIEAFRRWLGEHIQKFEGLPEVITRRQPQAWKEGIQFLEANVQPLLAASLAEFPKFISGTFSFEGSPYSVERIYKSLQRYYTDCEGVAMKLHLNSCRNDPSICLDSKSIITSRPVDASYLDRIPELIDSMEEMSCLLEEKIVPHPIYFSYFTTHSQYLNHLKTQIVDPHFVPLLASNLYFNHYETITNCFEIFRISENCSSVTQIHPHVYEYTMTFADLLKSLDFERHSQEVMKSFDTFVMSAMQETVKLNKMLELHRKTLEQTARSTHNSSAPLKNKMAKKALNDFKEYLLSFTPRIYSNSLEEVEAKMHAEQLLEEESQIRVKKKSVKSCSSKKGQKGKGNKHLAAVPGHLEIQEERTPFEELKQQILRSSSLLESAASAQTCSFKQTSLLQARVSLLRLEQAASYTSIFTGKVWLPVFIEEGYFALEQTFKGALATEEEDLRLHGLKALLKNRNLKALASEPIIEQLENGHIKSYRFLEAYNEEQKAKEWFTSHKANPIIKCGVDALEQVNPLDLLIKKAKRIAEVIEEVLFSQEIPLESCEKEECLEIRYEMTLPFVCLAPDKPIRLKPLIQRRKEAESCLQNASLFNQAVAEIIAYISRPGSSFTAQEAASYCKHILFMATKSIEALLQAILISQGKHHLRYCHDLNTLFIEAFPSCYDSAEVVQNLQSTLANVHLCLRYPLQKTHIYSHAHRISLAASQVFGFPLNALPRICVENASEKDIDLPNVIRQETQNVLLFAHKLYSDYLQDALKELEADV